MKNIHFAFILLIIFTFSACSQQGETGVSKNNPVDLSSSATNGSAKNATDDIPSPTANSPAISTSENASEKVWNDYVEKWGNDINLNYIPPEPDLYPLYIDGMQHKSASVRYTCVCKVFGYNQHEKKQEIIDTLKKLLDDPDETVRKAAQFSISVLNFTFEGPDFIRSPDGKDVAFYNYRDARFNDGNLWLYKDEFKEIWLLKNFYGSIGAINWSPDGKKIAVSNGGRLWNDVALVETSSGNILGDNLFAYIFEQQNKYGYKIGDNSRPDPWISFMEWSPDSNRALLFYSFFDDNRISQKGACIFNLQKQSFENLIPYGPSEVDYPEPELPKDFMW